MVTSAGEISKIVTDALGRDRGPIAAGAANAVMAYAAKAYSETFVRAEQTPNAPIFAGSQGTLGMADFGFLPPDMTARSGSRYPTIDGPMAPWLPAHPDAVCDCEQCRIVYRSGADAPATGPIRISIITGRGTSSEASFSLGFSHEEILDRIPELIQEAFDLVVSLQRESDRSVARVVVLEGLLKLDSMPRTQVAANNDIALANLRADVTRLTDIVGRQAQEIAAMADERGVMKQERDKLADELKALTPKPEPQPIDNPFSRQHSGRASVGSDW